MSSLLSASGIRKSFGGIVALNDVTLNVEKSKITALIGPNGAGKTTLFNVLTGFDTSDSGEIAFDGERTDHLPAWKIAQLGVVRTFQTPVGFPTMSVWENLVVAGSNTKWNTPLAAVFQRGRAREEEDRISAKAAELLGDLGLAALIDSRLEELSAGDRKLVEFGRQLMCEPRLLLLDEPAAGVNPEDMNRLSELIRQIHASGIGVLVIDHNLSFVLGVADYVYVLANGEVISEGTPSDVSEDPMVRSVYLGGS